MVGVSHNAPHEGLFSCQPELIGLFETLVNVIFCAKDLEGRYVEVNSAFVRRTGRSSKGEVIGTTARDHFIAELASVAGFKTTYSLTGQGMARFKEEDPVVSRVIAVKSA